MVNQMKKDFADDNFKFDENARKFSKWVENSVGKGEIAHYEQFLLFPQCFQKTFTADTFSTVSKFSFANAFIFDKLTFLFAKEML